MPDYVFSFPTLVQTLEHGPILVSAWALPELSCLDQDSARAQRQFQQLAEELIRKTPLDRWERMVLGGPARIEAFSCELASPKRSVAWREPLALKFPAVVWEHPGELSLAYLPSLEITIYAPKHEDLAALVAQHIPFALRRHNWLSLRPLLLRARAHQIALEELVVPLTLPTLKQAAQEAEQRERMKIETLNAVGVLLSDVKVRLPPAYEVAGPLRQLAETLTGRAPRSVLLVGPAGVGKTALIQELVRQREKFGLGDTPFWSTSGARLIAGMSGFGMWQQRCQALLREAETHKAILHLGNLWELLEVGKGGGSDQGIGAFLRPSLARGALLAVAECTPEQYPLLERRDPALLQTFTVLQRNEPTKAEGQAILREAAQALAKSTQHTISPAGLETLDRLHRRHATYSVFPGRPLRFLKNLLSDDALSAQIGPAEVTAAFARETGLPRWLLEESEKLDLDVTRRWFSTRVVGQPEAVELVVALLATAKAGLSRPRRPLASFLFLGPTGVGKTEMAKTLAEFCYGDPARLVRFDMSEFADPWAAQRLVGGLSGPEGLLTSKVREQPFGVVLFDELEKADPQFFDLLLPLLGEGRLTDAGGRLADFSNSMVIMTSNLGAEQFQRKSSGFGAGPPTAADARDHFLEHVRKFFRPELFNRLDRVVPFLPLDETTILSIARRELEKLPHRDGLRFRDLTLDLSDGLAAWLARVGYDPRYGARPLKRALERELLAPLSAALNRFSAERPLHVSVRLERDAPVVEARALDQSAGARAPKTGRPHAVRPPSLLTLVDEVRWLRRRAHRLRGSSAVMEMENEVFAFDRSRERETKRRNFLAATHVPENPAIERARKFLKNLRTYVVDVEGFEEQTLLDLYNGRALHEDELSAMLELTRGPFTELVMELYLRQFPQLRNLRLILFSESTEALRFLSQTYAQIALDRKLRVTPYSIRHLGTQSGSPPVLVLISRDKLTSLGLHKVSWNEFQANGSPSQVGLVLQLEGDLAVPCFQSEAGQHNVIQTRGNLRQTEPVLVDCELGRMVDYAPPSGVDRRGGVPIRPLTRSYDLEKRRAEDTATGRILTWSSDGLPRALGELIEERLTEAALKLVDS